MLHVSFRFAPLLVLSAAICGAADQPPKLRLDTDVRPVKYAADLTVSPTSLTFSGSVDIDVELAKPSSLIWLNAAALTIHEAKITNRGAAQTAQVVDGGPQFIGLRVARPLPAGPSHLRLTYDGKVDGKSTTGIFQGRDGDNLYLFTQFEEIDARRAFPCFDQPEFKTPWQVTLHVPKEDLAFANTPEVSSTDEAGGRKKVVFAPTKPLPSYLVAFGVGPFEVVEAGRAGKNKFPVRIITPKGKAYQAKYAAEVTAGVLDKLEGYFSFPYPYEKSDQLTIPLTFGFEAMENAGLVTYAENTLLGDPATDSISRQRRYYSDAAHELAHQWFGDLVTTAWWDDIWLNEAFATWMSAKIVATAHPEWNSRLSDLQATFGAMSADSLATARRIRQPIKSEDDIVSAFDGITYEKGAAVIRMFETWVGEKQFQTGVNAYLSRYAFKATRLGDFLDSIANAGNPRLTKAFTTFLDQPGLPEVAVELRCAGAPSVHVSQKRFLPIGSTGDKEYWQVPVCIRYSTDAGPRSECFLLDKTEADFKLTKTTSCPADLSANDNATGYYVARYGDAMLAKLMQPGNAFLNAAERLTLVHDLNSLAGAGDISESKALEGAAVFAGAPERQIVAQAQGIVAAARKFVPAELQPNYARFVQKTFGERAMRLGWTGKPDDAQETKLERTNLVPFVARDGGNAELRQEARRLADAWLKERKGVDPNMLGSVLSTAAYFGDRAYFDALVAALKSTNNLQQRNNIIAALGAFRDPAIVNDSMKLLLDPAIDGRETIGLLFGPTGEPSTMTLPFAFVQANYDALLKRLPSGAGFEAGALLPFVGNSFCDEKSRGEIVSFFKDRAKQFGGGEHNYDQAIESIRLCEAQKAAKAADVAAFFTKQ